MFMPRPTYFGAIEAGGTKFNCAFGLNHEAILEQKRIATVHPDDTLREVEAFFDYCVEKYGPMQSMGIACFGPVDLTKSSETYGYVINTPKPNWSFTPIVPRLEKRYGCPIGFDLDVNGSALGEMRFGAGRGLENVAYVTIGTGIGVGVIANGKSLNGLLHPEFGHISVHKLEGEPDGVCKFHKNCAEGLACGPAIEKRWGAPAETFPIDHQMWKSQAYYTAALCNAITLAYSPQRIILGGGVMTQPHLLAAIRKEFEVQLNGYVPAISRSGCVESYIVTPELDNMSGIAGAFVIAKESATNAVSQSRENDLAAV